MTATTIYRKDYTVKPIIYVKPIKRSTEEFEALPEGAKYLETKINIKSDLSDALKKIQEMYRHRNRSVYTIDYPWKTKTTMQQDEVKKEMKAQNDKDELLISCEKIILKKDDTPVLPPLIGSKIIYGYMNPKYFHTGNTTYQEEIGVNACKWIFGKDLEKNRGFLSKERKQREKSKATVKKSDSKDSIENYDCICDNCKCI